MLNEIELYVYENYIKNIIIEEKGVKKILEEEIEKLKLSAHEKEFVMHIINRQNIEVIKEKITKDQRSPYVRDNNYGDIKTNGLQKIDEPVTSKIDYSEANEKIFENYDELDEYLEKRFIPTYVILKKGKKIDGETERFPSIRLHHIMALKLSEAELEHVMDYLKKKNIRVGGKGSTLDGFFENYDYVTTYKESALPLSIPADETLQKIILYKKNNDKKLKEEIITDNLRLVPYVAYRYAISTGIDQHELESYGYEGLILSLDKFDVDLGYTFATYAISYIRGHILNGINEIVMIKGKKFYNDFVNAKFAIEKEYDIKLSDSDEYIDEVIDLLVATGKIGNNKDAIEAAKRKIIENVSLDDEEVVEEFVEDGQLIDTHDYAEEVLNKVSSEELYKFIDEVLTSREARVITLRYGLDDGVPKTLEEIGEMLGATRERVRQIEAKALRKMQNYIKRSNLKDLKDFETEKYGR